MGRCNNRRAQERAAQERNVPSRARFSKGPPKKNAGAGRGRGRGRGDAGGNRGGSDGGRDGGRGGRSGRNNEAVVQKLQDRVNQQRKDIGGISITRSMRNGNLPKRKRHPLDGIDVSKLDTITLTPESVAIVERLLKAYSVWEEVDTGDEEDGSNDTRVHDICEEEDGAGAIVESDGIAAVDVCNSETVKEEIEWQQEFGSDVNGHQAFTLLRGDDFFDDYSGDYDDEPDFTDVRDVDIVADSFEKHCDQREHSIEDIEHEALEDSCDVLINTPLFRNLTQCYSFQHDHVLQAMKASHKRFLASKNNSIHHDNNSSIEDEGILFEMAIDWLSLHLDESQLRKGFLLQRDPTNSSATSSFIESKSTDDLPGLKQTIKAIPHESISIMPKLTKSQYQKETAEAMRQRKTQELSTEFIRLGFHFSEVETVISLFQHKLDSFFDSVKVDGDGESLHPVSIKYGALFEELIKIAESSDMAHVDRKIDLDMEMTAITERDQEREVLEAIYAERFREIQRGSDQLGGELGDSQYHYQIKVIPIADLIQPARSDECLLHVLTQIGYPLVAPPKLWFVNPTLPPTLLRRVTCHIQGKAKELIGQASVYDIVEFLSENISFWQRKYADEEAQIEEYDGNVGHIMNEVNLEDDEDEIDYYTATFTAEERKKLSRRQRQKLRAAERSHARGEILLERQRLKEKRDEERRERIRIEDSTLSYRNAERVVEKRWTQWVEEEAEKAARKAMNDAFLRDQSREEARAAAEKARLEVLRFHGEFNESHDIQVTNADLCVNDVKQMGADHKTPDVEHMKNEDFSVTSSAEVVKQSRMSQATATTLAFTDKLRKMYEQKAREKSASSNQLGTIHLVDASQDERSKTDELNAPSRIPAPVVTPSPGIDTILRDIMHTQHDQPWLVNPEARVPTVGSNDFHTSKTLTSAEAKKQRDISQGLRVSLEEKYNNRHPSGRGRRNEANKFEEILSNRSKLPAYKMRDEVLKTIKCHQVTVVSGDTGCGKTTQVPQLVLDDLIMNNRGAEASIIVTQPRRISAVGVSERIAIERCERIGDTVGYSIRLESKRSSKTRLLLCTTGVLLRRLQVDPDLASVSHVFVDEVHERDLNTDFLLIILRDLLQRRKSLKLVLMSATLNAETFSRWFGGCPVVSIPGRAQPVKEYRLEDALQVTGHLILEQSDCAKKKSRRDKDDTNPSKSSLRRLYPNYNKNVIDSLAVVDESVVNYELIGKLLLFICTTLEDGAILVFLPGFKEITNAMETLSKIDYFRDANATIYPLHSSLSSSEQAAIFQRPPIGKRKISTFPLLGYKYYIPSYKRFSQQCFMISIQVLSTNIAETSITIDDVVFVIDSGRVKENRYDDLNKMPTLSECWVSKASAKQRRGRAGRVKPGYCWHLYSTHTHDHEINDYQLPEMLRVGLEDLVLQILILDLGEPSTFLMKAVDPPSDLAVKNALDLLESLGAAECNWNEEQEQRNVSTSLTALGYHLATLPVHPRVGKMMIYGALFGVFDRCLTIAATMTSRSPFISSFNNRDAADEARRRFSPDDHISVLLAYNQWRDLRRRDGRQSKSFLAENFLSYTSLVNLTQLRKQLEKYMIDIGFSLPAGSLHLNDPSMDSNDMHLVRAVIAAGLYPNIIVAPKTFSGKSAGEVAFRGQKGEVYLHPCTIAFTSKNLDSRYCCYHEIVKTSKVYVRDCTTVSKFSILLFGGVLKVYQSHGVATVDEWLKFRINAKQSTLVKYLRSCMEALLLEKIMNPELDVTATSKGKGVIDAVSAVLKLESTQQVV